PGYCAFHPLHQLPVGLFEFGYALFCCERSAFPSKPSHVLTMRTCLQRLAAPFRGYIVVFAQRRAGRCRSARLRGMFGFWGAHSCALCFGFPVPLLVPDGGEPILSYLPDPLQAAHFRFTQPIRFLYSMILRCLRSW